MILSKEEYEMYKKIENEVSDAHPYKCVCGKYPTTGLHERNCSAFRKSVEKKFLKWMKKKNEGKTGVGYKMTIEDELHEQSENE